MLFLFVFIQLILSNYMWKRRLTVANPGTMLLNEDILIVLDTNDLITTGKLNGACSDISFVLEDNTELSYFRENSCNQEETNFWVQISEIPPSSDLDFYVLYSSTTQTGTRISFSDSFLGLFNTTDCPSAYTGIVDGNEGYYLKAGDTFEPGVTGAGHKHVIDGIVTTSTSEMSGCDVPFFDSNMPTAEVSHTAHTHDLPQLSNADTGTEYNLDFPRYTPIWCVSEFHDLETSYIAVEMADPSLDAEWTPFDLLNNRLVYSDDSNLLEGSDNFHRHSYPGSTTLAGNNHKVMVKGGSGSPYMPDDLHTHYSTSGGDTNVADGAWPNTILVLFYVRTGTKVASHADQIVFATAPPPRGYTRYHALDGYFIRGGTLGTVGNSEASTPHLHSATVHLPLSSSESQSVISGGSEGCVLSHGHEAPFDTDSSAVEANYHQFIAFQRKQSLAMVVGEEIAIACDDPTCGGHGDCIRDGLNAYCLCDTTWNVDETTCTITTCDTIPANESASCGDHATCIDYNSCECHANYTKSVHCNITLCNEVWGDENPCSGHGDCWPYNTCTCHDNYYGASCDVTTCESVWNNSTDTICLGRGECLTYDVCSCFIGDEYYGNNCELTSCFFISSLSPDSCGEFGNCLEFNTCTCNQSATFCDPLDVGRTGDCVFGSQCEEVILDGDWGTESEIVIGYYFAAVLDRPELVQYVGGENKAFFACSTLLEDPTKLGSSYADNSNCFFTVDEDDAAVTLHLIIQDGFEFDSVEIVLNVLTGDETVGVSITKSFWKCHGEPNYSDSVCTNSERGTCIGTGVCQCEESYQWAPDCSVTTCFDALSNTSEACGAFGECDDYDTCRCIDEEKYWGEDCGNWTCNSIPRNGSEVCSNHGECIDHNICRCFHPFNSTWCDVDISLCEPECDVDSTCVEAVCVCEPEECDENVSSCSEVGVCLCFEGFGLTTTTNTTLNETNTFCESCGIGFYSIMEGSQRICNSCPGVSTTHSTGQTSVDACVCPENFVGISPNCYPCELCKYESVCIFHNETIMCECAADFSGPFCNISTLPCGFPGCQNDGVCVEETGICNCEETGFEDSRCKTPVCTPECDNSAQCVVVSANVHECDCNTAQFPASGDTCDEPVCDSQCDSTGGSCIQSTTDPSTTECECPDGWSALPDHLFCRPICDPPCENNSTCTAPNHCNCLKGFVSPTSQCKYPVCNGKAANHSNVCNGKGVCKNPAVCECDSNLIPNLGQVDKWCKDNSMNIYENVEQILGWAGAGLGAVIAIIGLIIFVVFVVMVVLKRMKLQRNKRIIQTDLQLDELDEDDQISAEAKKTESAELFRLSGELLDVLKVADNEAIIKMSKKFQSKAISLRKNIIQPALIVPNLVQALMSSGYDYLEENAQYVVLQNFDTLLSIMIVFFPKEKVDIHNEEELKTKLGELKTKHKGVLFQYEIDCCIEALKNIDNKSEDNDFKKVINNIKEIKEIGGLFQSVVNEYKQFAKSWYPKLLVARALSYYAITAQEANETNIIKRLLKILQDNYGKSNLSFITGTVCVLMDVFRSRSGDEGAQKLIYKGLEEETKRCVHYFVHINDIKREHGVAVRELMLDSIEKMVFEERTVVHANLRNLIHDDIIQRTILETHQDLREKVVKIQGLFGEIDKSVIKNAADGAVKKMNKRYVDLENDRMTLKHRFEEVEEMRKMVGLKRGEVEEIKRKIEAGEEKLGKQRSVDEINEEVAKTQKQIKYLQETHVVKSLVESDMNRLNKLKGRKDELEEEMLHVEMNLKRVSDLKEQIVSQEEEIKGLELELASESEVIGAKQKEYELSENDYELQKAQLKQIQEDHQLAIALQQQYVEEKNKILDGKKAPKEMEDNMSSLAKQTMNLFDEGEFDVEIPKSYICPISLEIMKIPVTLVESGITYEEESIKTWLEHNDTDPVTNKKLETKQYVVSYTLKGMIEEWVTNHRKK